LVSRQAQTSSGWAVFGERMRVREQERRAVGLERKLATQSAQHHLVFDVLPVGAQCGLAAGALGRLGASAGEDHVELLAAGGFAGLKPVLGLRLPFG
jgi:hypothetical protein